MLFKRLKYKLSYFRKLSANVDRNFKLNNQSKIVRIDPEFIVEDCEFEGYNYLFGFGRIYKSKLGAFTYVQYGANIGYAKIGKFCSIGPNVMIAHGEHPSNFLSTHPIFFEFSYIKEIPSLVDCSNVNIHKEVNIGSDVWIGANCYIKDGVSIGDGAIVGAGAVVTKDVLPYSVVAGVPAKVIKMRFDESTIEELMELKWWTWDLVKILESKKLFQIQIDKHMLRSFGGKLE